MSSLHPNAQAIVERFATRDVSRQHLEKQVVERAISQHLEALEVPQRPVRWFADAMSALAHMTLRLDPITSNVSDALARLKVQLSPLHVDSEPGDAAWAAEHAVWTTATAAGKNALWNAAWADGHTAAWQALRGAAWSAAWDAIFDRAGDAETLDEPLWLGAAALLTLPEDALRAAAKAVAAVNACSVFPHPTQERLLRIWLSMVEAVDAGLAVYWITRHEIICVPQPALSIHEGRLHCEDSAAVQWSSGERYWFLRGAPAVEPENHPS